MLTALQQEAVKRCRSSVTWFLRNFGKLKHPSAGILPFNPFSYQRKAIEAFRSHRFNIFKKNRQCFVGESMVWGPNGPKRIDQIKKGDLVYSYNETTGLVEVVPVLELFNNGKRRCVQVKTKTGHNSVATTDHQYYTLKGEIPAAELTKSDVLLEVNDPERYGYDVNESEAILLGYLLTDGYYGHRVHFTNTRWKYLLDFKKHLKLRFGIDGKIKPHNRDKETKRVTSYRIEVNGLEIRRWLSDLGIHGQVRDKKVLPETVFRWSNKSLAILFSRAFAGDGWYSAGTCNEVGICSESIQFLNQVKQLMTRFGVNMNLYKETKSKSSMPKLRAFGSVSFANFVSKIGIFGKQPRSHITKGFVFNIVKGKIKSVTKAGYQTVYDISVPPHHNYIVDGAVVHNSGASKISGAFALWYAMFFSHKTVLIVSRKDEDAMMFLADQVRFLFDNLPEWMKDAWCPVKENEHELQFPNGSRIRSLTSHPDVLRSNASSLNIIDEAAFIPQMSAMWASGWPCTRHDTLIQTESGLIKVGELASGGDPWIDHDINVMTDEGMQHSNKAYVSGNCPTIIFNTELGFEEEGTYHHQIRIIDQMGDYVWKRLDDLEIDDIVVSKPGQFVGKRQFVENVEITSKFAEILGLYIGDGSLSRSRPKRFRIYFDPQDELTRDNIVDQFNSLPLPLGTQAYPDKNATTVILRLNSHIFSEFLVRTGLASKTCPQDAEIPGPVLKSDKQIICAFLRGLFDSDGWCYQSDTSLKLGMSTTSKKLAEQVQVVLHALGIISRRIEVKEHTPDRFSQEPYWRVEVNDSLSKLKFRELIGFLSVRKQNALDSFIGSSEHHELQHVVLVREFAEAALASIIGNKTFRQCDDKRKWNLYRIRREARVRLSLVKQLATEFNLQDRLSRYVLNGFFFDRVAALYKSKADTYDLSVPANNTYLANGIINHNTLQHGGSAIVVSTTNGVGGWYWSTYTDAEAGLNPFNPIIINWWDMDWVIEYTDPLSKTFVRIAPRDGIRPCESKEEILKYGPYWSPWLETQWRALQERGEGWKFEQEILAAFVGSGNTILDKAVLAHVATTVRDPDYKVTDPQPYVNATTSVAEELPFDFTEPDEGLWIWSKPVPATPAKMRGNQIIRPGTPAHAYVMGVDIATGKGRDYSTIEVFDVDEQEQVAEFMARLIPREFVKYIDRIGRWYNCALAVIERNNGGDLVVDELRYNMMYPRLWRKKDINDKPQPQGARSSRRRTRPMKVAAYGFATSQSSKQILNKYLINCVRDNPELGYTIYSRRLLKQLQTYVRKRDKAGRDTNKTEAEEGSGNFDDLVMATALALVGTGDAFIVDAGNLTPTGGGVDFKSNVGPIIMTDESRAAIQKEYAQKGGVSLLMPMAMTPDELPELAAQRQLDNFTCQLGGIPISQGKPLVTPQKWFYTRDSEKR